MKGFKEYCNEGHIKDEAKDRANEVLDQVREKTGKDIKRHPISKEEFDAYIKYIVSPSGNESIYISSINKISKESELYGPLDRLKSGGSVAVREGSDRYAMWGSNAGRALSYIKTMMEVINKLPIDFNEYKKLGTVRIYLYNFAPSWAIDKFTSKLNTIEPYHTDKWQYDVEDNLEYYMEHGKTIYRTVIEALKHGPVHMKNRVVDAMPEDVQTIKDELKSIIRSGRIKVASNLNVDMVKKIADALYDNGPFSTMEVIAKLPKSIPGQPVRRVVELLKEIGYKSKLSGSGYSASLIWFK